MQLFCEFLNHFTANKTVGYLAISGKRLKRDLRFALGAGLIFSCGRPAGSIGRTEFLVGDLGKHGQFRDLHKEIGSMVSRCDLAYPGLGSDHRGARPWPAPDRRTLAEAYSCPCRVAHFELRSFHDSGAWPPRTLELLRLCFCIRFSIPWVIPRRGVIVQRA